MPDDDQQGPADGDHGFLLAAAAGDAPVSLSQERLRTSGARGTAVAHERLASDPVTESVTIAAGSSGRRQTPTDGLPQAMSSVPWQLSRTASATEDNERPENLSSTA
jgi:hypothetical protein